MSLRITTKNVWWCITLCLVVLAIVAVGATLYGRHLQSQARLLMADVVEVSPRTQLSDLRRKWQHDFSADYVQENERSFGVHLDNSLLFKLHLVRPAFMAVNIFGTMQRVTDVEILFYSSDAYSPPAVILHEFLGTEPRPRGCVLKLVTRDQGELWRAYLAFPYDQRAPSAFDFQISCLVKVRGCEDPLRLLPSIATLRSTCARSDLMAEEPRILVPRKSK